MKKKAYLDWTDVFPSLGDHIPEGNRDRLIPVVYENCEESKTICIVVHGFGSSKESPTAEMLFAELPARGIGAVAFDLPGHGENTQDLTVARCLMCLGDVENWIVCHYPGAKVVWFASSFGAWLTLLYHASRTPERKANASFWESGEYSRMIRPYVGRKNRAFLRSAAVCMPALLETLTAGEKETLKKEGYIRFGEDYGYGKPLILRQFFFDELKENDVFSIWEPEFAALSMIHGENDEEVPLGEAKRFAEKFGVPLTVVAGGDHRLSIPGAQETVLAKALTFFGAGEGETGGAVPEPLKKIASFTVDHLRLQPGIYVSRKDRYGDVTLTTFDLRFKRPNLEPVMDMPALHTLEHLGATFLRNHPLWGEKTVYFGPMGCRTGFYAIFAGDLTGGDILGLIQELLQWILDFSGKIPGAEPSECGNYSEQNLTMAKWEAKRYLEVLTNATEENLRYPERENS
jgi:S-ribosylhomocysteine lyase